LLGLVSRMATLPSADVDYYAVFDLTIEATRDEVKGKYKKMVPLVHPDRNPDDPHAKDKFQRLQKAYELLMDEQARAAYDAVLRTKMARKLREAEMDKDRKRMLDKLVDGENAYKKLKAEEAEAKRNLAAQMDRLKRDGWKNYAEQMGAEEAAAPPRSTPASSGTTAAAPPATPAAVLKVRWSSKKGSYTKEQLTAIFQVYGPVESLRMMSQSALLVYRSGSSVSLALGAGALGFASNRLELSVVEDAGTVAAAANPSANHAAAAASVPAPAAQPAVAPKPAAASLDLSAEGDILTRMRQAAEAQRKAKEAAGK
jgi:DnaJ family protein C protein 17